VDKLLICNGYKTFSGQENYNLFLTLLRVTMIILKATQNISHIAVPFPNLGKSSFIMILNSV
jgi:hypothetical protein